jgi:hypothetical protein
LNGYRQDEDGKLPEPREWLNNQWKERYPKLPPLESYLSDGRALLLLDALNETPHFNAARWKAFTQRACREGNRIVYSCRSLDYSGGLSSEQLPIPQVQAQPMNKEQMREFLRAYSPAHEEQIWRELSDPRQFEFYQTPYFLALLCAQVDQTGYVPKGRAALFTGFVRQALNREIEREGELFRQGELMTARDHLKLAQRANLSGPFDLPEDGPLLRAHCDLAFRMQEKEFDGESKGVRVSRDHARELIAHEREEDIMMSGV